MRAKSKVTLPAGVKRVRAELEEWRGQRDRGNRIPEALWEAAVAAARQHGVHRVSRALGLDYSCLKRRMREGSGGERLFVELGASRSASGTSCVVELEKGNGAKLRVCVDDAATVDWCRVKEAFLGA
jgi:hypothetical protein